MLINSRDACANIAEQLEETVSNYYALSQVCALLVLTTDSESFEIDDETWNNIVSIIGNEGITYMSENFTIQCSLDDANILLSITDVDSSEEYAFTLTQTIEESVSLDEYEDLFAEIAADVTQQASLMSAMASLATGFAGTTENLSDYSSIISASLAPYIDSAASFYSDAVSYCSSLGPSGCLSLIQAYLSQYESDLNQSEEDDSISFNTADKRTSSNICGLIWSGLGSVISTVVSAVLAIVHPILGLISSVVGSIFSSISSAYNGLSEATVDDTVMNRLYMTPLLQISFDYDDVATAFTVDSTYDSTYFDEFYEDVQTHGYLWIHLTGRSILAWINTDGKICLEMYASMNSNAIIDNPTYSNSISSFFVNNALPSAPIDAEYALNVHDNDDDDDWGTGYIVLEGLSEISSCSSFGLCTQYAVPDTSSSGQVQFISSYSEMLTHPEAIVSAETISNDLIGSVSDDECISTVNEIMSYYGASSIMDCYDAEAQSMSSFDSTQRSFLAQVCYIVLSDAVHLSVLTSPVNSGNANSVASVICVSGSDAIDSADPYNFRMQFEGATSIGFWGDCYGQSAFPNVGNANRDWWSNQGGCMFGYLGRGGNDMTRPLGYALGANVNKTASSSVTVGNLPDWDVLTNVSIPFLRNMRRSVALRLMTVYISQAYYCRAKYKTDTSYVKFAEIAYPTSIDRSAYLAPPSYTRKAVIKSTIIIASITAITLAATVTATVCVKRAIAKLQAKQQLKVVKAMQTALADPTSDNLSAYTKTIRRYNLLASFMGWGSYTSAYSFNTASNDSSSTGSVISSISSSAISSVSTQLSDTEDSITSKLDQILSLIKTQENS